MAGDAAIGFEFVAMGGVAEVRLAGLPDERAAELAELAIAEVRRIEHTFSRYRPDSVIGRINASAGSGECVVVDDETAGLLALVLEQARPLAPNNPICQAVEQWSHWVARTLDAGVRHLAWATWTLATVVPALLAAAAGAAWACCACPSAGSVTATMPAPVPSTKSRREIFFILVPSRTMVSNWAEQVVRNQPFPAASRRPQFLYGHEEHPPANQPP